MSAKTISIALFVGTANLLLLTLVAFFNPQKIEFQSFMTGLAGGLGTAGSTLGATMLVKKRYG